MMEDMEITNASWDNKLLTSEESKIQNAITEKNLRDKSLDSIVNAQN